MAHKRKQIRQAVVGILSELEGIGQGGLDLEDRVFSNRIAPVLFKNLPVVNVYTKSETAEPRNATGPFRSHRDLDLVIEVISKDGDDEPVDDVLDDIAEAIEYAMEENTTLSGTCYDSYIIRNDFDSSIEGEQPIGWLRMTYRVLYKSTPQETP